MPYSVPGRGVTAYDDQGNYQGIFLGRRLGGNCCCPNCPKGTCYVCKYGWATCSYQVPPTCRAVVCGPEPHVPCPDPCVSNPCHHDDPHQHNCGDHHHHHEN